MKREDSVFPNLWNSFLENDAFGAPSLMGDDGTLPAVNVMENDDAFCIEMAAPGKDKSDFSVNLDNGVLTISTEKKETHEAKVDKGKYTRREFNYEHIRRSFSLPESADLDNIKASYEQGILHVEIPKRDEAKPKPIKLIDVK